MQETLSLDEKFITNIFQKYLKAKVILQKVAKINNLQEKAVTYASFIKPDEQLIEYQKYLQLVETILALMSKSEYTCLIKDFLSSDKNKFWWKKYYSQNDYQKLRNKAINHFLYLMLI